MVRHFEKRGRGIVAMKHLKFAVLATGILGLVSLFALPFMSAPLKLTLWDLRIADAGQVYLVLAAFLVPAIIAGLAIAQKGMARWHGIVAAVFFALGVVKCRENFGEGTGVGAKLMLIAAAIGLVIAIVATVKPSAPARA
jgi:hypothetical protein